MRSSSWWASRGRAGPVALLALAWATAACSFELDLAPEEATPIRPRHYTVQLEVRESRSGPGGAPTAIRRSTARLSETRDSDGSRRVVIDSVSGESTAPAAGAAVDVSGSGLAVTAAGDAGLVQGRSALDLQATLFVLQVVVPVIAYQPPRTVRAGSTVAATAGAMRQGARQSEPARQLRAERVASTVHLPATSSLMAYRRTARAYEVERPYTELIPGPSSLERPTRAETYVRDPGPGLGDAIFSTIDCLVNKAFVCPAFPDPPPERRTRTVVVDGPSTIGATLTGAFDVQLSSLVYPRDEPTLLQATATGRHELAGDLTTGPGVPTAVAGKRVRLAADWTAAVELTDEWPRPPERPRVPLPLLLLSAALLVAACTGLGLVNARRAH